MPGVNRSENLNKAAEDLTPAEEKAILKAFSNPMGEAQREILTYFRRVKKQAQVLDWVLKGYVDIEAYSREYSVIQLKAKDGSSHRVELF